MSGNQLATVGNSGVPSTADGEVYVTVYVNNQLLGIPVSRVQEVLVPESVANIPLASSEIAGAINLRGRIVTVIDVRVRLHLPARGEDDERLCATVEHKGELYALLVDSVGEVLNLSRDQLEPNPGTLDPAWRSVSSGIIRLDRELIIMLDIDALLEFMR